MDDGNRDETIPVRVFSSVRVVNVHVPPSDIDKWVGFSLLRCIVSIFSLVLVATDIPRTGLGLRFMDNYFCPVSTDTAMYFGPYAYQIVHIHKTEPSLEEGNTPTYTGTCEGESIDAVDLWSYKLDSLSIPTRTLAEHLNVTAYPPCVLYRGTCHADTLSLQTTFAMLDGLISALVERYFPRQPVNGKKTYPATQFKFGTKSLWIDRLHHYIVKSLSKHTELRIHSAQYFDSSSEQLRTNICDPPVSDHGAPAARPDICYHPIGWPCDHPELGSSVQVPLWDHLAVRLSTLRQQYPELEFDLTMLSTRMTLASQKWLVMPSIFYSTDNIEITTLIRGRKCEQQHYSNEMKSCVTVVVDDYRYERATVESDINQWYMMISLLRGAGQAYMWVRIVCIWVGCYKARSAESKLHSADLQTRITHALVTLVKIPSHVVVYGSWFPVCCYALAHYIDCSLTHLINDNAWSTVNGSITFDPVRYFLVASIQMRNIWFVSLFLKMVALGHHYFLQARAKHWTAADGVVGVRGTLIGMISVFTVFGPMRARCFRDSSVVRFEVLSDHNPLHGGFSLGYNNVAEYGFHFDVKGLTIAIFIIYVAAQVMHLIVLLAVPSVNIAVLSRSHFIPFSTNTLWSRATLVTYWRVRMGFSPTAIVSASEGLHRINNTQIPHLEYRERGQVMSCFHKKIVPSERFSAARLLVSRSFRFPTLQPIDECEVCIAKLKRNKQSRWLLVQGCPNHDTLVHLELRTKEHWSILRLKNIAMMTDPIVLLRLCLVGLPLYIYRVKLRSEAAQQQPQVHHTTVIGEPRHTRNQSLMPVPETTSVVESQDDLEPLSPFSRSRVYVLPCPLNEILECFDSFPGYCDDLLARYELIATTSSYSLPWTVLVNCG